MDICTDINNIKKFSSSALTIGAYDGVHQGHIKVLQKLVQISLKNNVPSVLITFNPHPRSIVSSLNSPSLELLMSIDEKNKIFKDFGLDYILIIPFSYKFSMISAHDFLENYIVKYFKPKDIAIGFNHHFGSNKEGDVKFLKREQEKYGFRIHEIPPLMIRNNIISSTLIRKLIKKSSIKEGNSLLGKNLSLSGKVVKGKGIGQTIDFPTANIKPYDYDKLIPPRGVYCVDVFLRKKKYIGMCNIGTRPTLYKDNKDVIEVHIITNNKLNIYGETIRIEFKDFIRKEKKYSNIEELSNQLRLDRFNCIAN